MSKLPPEVLSSIINVAGNWALGMANTPDNQGSITKFCTELEEYYEAEFNFLSRRAEEYFSRHS